MPKGSLQNISTRSLLEMTESYGKSCTINSKRFYRLKNMLFSTDSIQGRFPHPDRPKCNSILHLCGSWLFEAAFIGSDYCKYFNNDSAPSISVSNDNVPTSGLTNSKNLPSPSPRPVKKYYLSSRIKIFTEVFNHYSTTFLKRPLR